MDKILAILRSIPSLVPVRGEIATLAWKVLDEWDQRNEPTTQAAWVSAIVGILAKLPEADRQKAIAAVLELYPVRL